ncbi:MAG: NAD(P)/FAD-dependent oxidoreductase, partial [Betaproteobacteria bacterium]|nr:NAD(P)/FAD-dependent oxidoreductase [Betaproteobacteria bacterium]
MPAGCDVLVVGGGPAGMAAATTAAGLGLSTRLLDEQRAPGGQIYRGITTVPAALARRLGEDYAHGRTLTDALAASTVDVEPDATVFDIDADLNVAWLRDGTAREIAAGHLILATGAMERATAVPGWTLPGVMYAGAAQLLLKTAASVPSGRVALAGNGPLLLLVANQLADAGANVVALVETTRFADVLGAAPHLPRALAAGEYLRKGMVMMDGLRRRRLRWIRGATAVEVIGGQRAEALQVTVGGRTERIVADTVLLHFGVIPNTQITRLLRLEHVFDSTQVAWRPRTDHWGRSSHGRVWIAGDGAGIGGARAAEASGVLAALDAAWALGRIGIAERDRGGAQALRERSRQLSV